jgi:hypothetical protein
MADERLTYKGYLIWMTQLPDGRWVGCFCELDKRPIRSNGHSQVVMETTAHHDMQNVLDEAMTAVDELQIGRAI